MRQVGGGGGWGWENLRPEKFQAAGCPRNFSNVVPERVFRCPYLCVGRSHVLSPQQVASRNFRVRPQPAKPSR